MSGTQVFTLSVTSVKAKFRNRYARDMPRSLLLEIEFCEGCGWLQHWQTIPFLIFCYLFNFLDRIDLALTKFTRDLHFSEAVDDPC